MKEKIKDILWTIQAFIRQPIVPIVSVQYIMDNKCSYTGNNYMTDKYVYYWKGDFKTGKSVKVRSLDLARYKLKENRLNMTRYEDENSRLYSQIVDWEEKLERVTKVNTTDLGETFVKNEIIKILKGELEDNYENNV